MSANKNFVPRVNQLDAIQLDKDVLRLLRENLFTSIQNYAPSIYMKYHPELDLLLHTSVWLASVGRQFSSFGQDILLICYNKDQLTTSRLCLHFLLTVIPKYIRANSEQRFVGNELLAKVITVVENTTLILAVINFFRFLKTGRKPSLIDFLLGLDYITLHGSKRREIGYKYLTRELLWGGYMELLGLILPMINYHKLRRILGDFFTLSKLSRPTEIKEPMFDINSICAYCGDRPTLPHHMGCGHIFCYYCLHGNILTDPEFRCPQCQAKKIKIMPVEIKDKI